MSSFPRFLLIACCLFLFNCESFSAKEPTNTAKEEDTLSNTVVKVNTRLDNEFLINGVSFLDNDTYVYLFKAEDDTFDLIDSTKVINTNFKFKGSAETPSIYKISNVKNKNKGFSFLVDASDIYVFLNKRVDFSTVYSASKIQKEYLDYISQMTDFKDKGIALYYGMKGDFSSQNLKTLRQGRLELFSEQNEYVKSFIKNHSDSYFSAMLINDNLETYNSKTLRALYNGLSQELRDIEFAKRIDSLIVIKESNIEKRLPVVVAKKVEQSFKNEYRPKAYKIDGLNPYGQALSLNSIPKGKVILVDFWASWCAPCRATNPTLVSLYNKYKNQGFEILSVSEDKGEAEWLNAIALDGLTWDYHIIDKNKRIAFRYGVESIPFKLLIDKNGNIASEKISGSALENRIKELLKE
ncbi:thiol-disulfide isomerase/thioredoxin [Lacinutrix venerupis]|uniref:TlpA disulfide reductase family protein n=1 Tax=Lacinutrix venerupis TaxID=1486034 RepID=UPI000EB43643|nr:TlpA disulfide reductase family protein [Lacinutrix venerupis]RLJ68891.1 thiol-disulfide isomerase/thioredoxin [Lacinutrix venerupis]